MTALLTLEQAADDLAAIYTIAEPPVPIEIMLRQPKADMWDQVDITQLSGSFLNLRDYYAPRASLARLLARHVASSVWGHARGLGMVLGDYDLLDAFARMLLIPRGLATALSEDERTPMALSVRFEVPEDVARQRLGELAPYLPALDDTPTAPDA